MGLFARRKGARGERILVASLAKAGFTDAHRLLVTHRKDHRNPDVAATDPETGIEWKFENKFWSTLPVWFKRFTHHWYKGSRAAQYIAFGPQLVALSLNVRKVIDVKDQIFEHRDDPKLYKRFAKLFTLIKSSDVLVLRSNNNHPYYIRFFGNWNAQPTLPKTP